MIDLKWMALGNDHKTLETNTIIEMAAVVEKAGEPVVTTSEGDVEVSSNWEDVCPTFDDMNLKEDLLRGIYAYGFEKPSAIQQRAVKPVLLGRDIIAQAQSGEELL